MNEQTFADVLRVVVAHMRSRHCRSWLLKPTTPPGFNRSVVVREVEMQNGVFAVVYRRQKQESMGEASTTQLQLKYPKNSAARHVPCSLHSARPRNAKQKSTNYISEVEHGEKVSLFYGRSSALVLKLLIVGVGDVACET